MIESIVLYDFLDIETELTRHSPSKYAVSWLYSFDKGAILDTITKKIVGYGVVCPSELLNTICEQQKSTRYGCFFVVYLFFLFELF